MIDCPNCKQPGISTWGKLRTVPGLCKKCGALVVTDPNLSALIHAISFTGGFIIAGFFAFKYWSWYPLLGLVAFLLSIEYLVFKYVPLVLVGGSKSE